MKAGVLVKVLLAGIGVLAATGAMAQGKDSAVICQTLEPPILDPSGGAAAAIREVTYGNIFEGLVALDQNSKIVPALAERWDVSADGLKYTFHLRRNARFHDDTPMTSADVKFS
ncbi:MAG TPA: ABC transporter substrate-binding protein, partial [Rhabdaerophilum sp.]|nr:ABC transporter substrate-binding protein [Rhabdaerophilum sp.]